MRLLCFATLICATSAVSAAPSPNAGSAQKQAVAARMPLAFEANAGQWHPAVRYAGRAGDYSVLLTAAGPSLTFGGTHRVDIAMPGSNPAPRIEGLSPLAARTSYMVGARDAWRFGIANYSRIRYNEVYPGIDVVYYGANGDLEYDFVLRPGADPSAIQMRFHGADRVAVTPQGDVVMDATGGTLVQKRPLIYQETSRGGLRPVGGRYAMLAPGLVGLKIDNYDRTLPLIIDPVLTFANFMGGKAEDRIQGVKVGPNGKLYIVGYTMSSDFLATEGAYATGHAAAGVANIFLAVADVSAPGSFALEYLTYLGGKGGDKPIGVDVDAEGNVYIVGNTTSSDFPTAGEAFNTELPSGSGSVFISKLNPALSGSEALVYSSYFGGTDMNTVNGMSIDRNGMVYLIGTTTSTDFPVTDGAYAGVIWGTDDAFLTKIDPNSTTLAYSTYLGGENQDDGRAIAVAANGLVYFSVTTMSTQFPMAMSANRTTLSGDTDAIVGVMDMNQSGFDSLVTSTYFGGSDHDEVRKLALDSQGRVLLTGFTFSSDFPITADAVQGQGAGNTDAFVSVIDPSRSEGFLVYSTYLSGTRGEVAYDIAGDASGNVYVVGYTLSFDFPVSPDATQPNYGEGVNLFVCKLRPGSFGRDGLVFSTYLGGVGIGVPTSLSLGSDGTLHVVGYATAGIQSGSSDGFILAFSQLAGQPLRSDRRSTSRAPRY